MRPLLVGSLLVVLFSVAPRGQFGLADQRSTALPEDLAKVSLTATGTPSFPFALVHLFSQDGFKGYVVVDSAGKIVWHYRTVDYPFGAGRRRNGNFIFMDKRRGLLEVNARGEVVHERLQGDAQHELHHDAIVTPADTVLYLAFDSETVAGKPLKGERIGEWFPDTGRDITRWRSWEHLSPTDDRGPRTGGEWLHANSLSIGPRGNILVSFHYINQIVSISADWQRFEWRLGGIRPTIPLSVEQQFSGQHTAVEVEPNRVVLFDNGRDRGGYSRALELDITGGVARTVWQWRPPHDNYSSAISSARRLANGNTLIAFGMSKGQAESTGPIEAFEVTRAGAIVWHLTVAGTTTMFRVEPLAQFDRRTLENPAR